jgi:hypothetical protein
LGVDVREPGEARAGGPELNREILDAYGALIKQLAATGQSIAASFRVAPSDLLALVKLDGVVTMKELAHRMGCDASFITKKDLHEGKPFCLLSHAKRGTRPRR